MAQVKGIVEGQHEKWEKWNILVNGTWYNTKLEWAKEKPVEGDEVEFDDGGRNYTKNLRILTHGGGVTQPSKASSGGGFTAKPKGNYNLGVELGHASNVAKDMAIQASNAGLIDNVGSDDWYKFWVTHTQKVYGVMKNLREQYEKSPSPAKSEESDAPVVMQGASKPSSAEVTEADIFPT